MHKKNIRQKLMFRSMHKWYKNAIITKGGVLWNFVINQTKLYTGYEISSNTQTSKLDGRWFWWNIWIPLLCKFLIMNKLHSNSFKFSFRVKSSFLCFYSYLLPLSNSSWNYHNCTKCRGLSGLIKTVARAA